jgi:hypothetical protein
MNKDMKEESIERMFGRKHPFKVPEGYFEQFPARLMAALPEQQKPLSIASAHVSKVRLLHKFHIWQVGVAAASVIAVLFTLNLLFFRKSAQPVQRAQNPSVNMAVDQAFDFGMIDNEDIYTDLADNESH